MHNDIEKILVSEQEIQNVCKKLGKQLTKDYQGKTPLVVGILIGCVPFMAELIKHIDIPLTTEFMRASSYHGATQSSGQLTIKVDLTCPIEGKDIIIVEDIIDTGLTLKAIKELLLSRKAKSVNVVTLLDKPDGRKVEFIPEYIGVTIPKEFVVGFGLDYNELYRNLPYIGVLKPSVYEK